ncbi:MAG: hypothetical protein QGI86_17680 [Candidatus Poribacteria bacterium]|nr:hypothetical protein [Candidatus Poribacteria bacterium]MDP6751927.1 hypothetical protein [Candidatus Poribacteria bacterium]MDP6995075.1 hypothetical protein [Candidatus Poribacteria bacterium]
MDRNFCSYAGNPCRDWELDTERAIIELVENEFDRGTTQTDDQNFEIRLHRGKERGF